MLGVGDGDALSFNSTVVSILSYIDESFNNSLALLEKTYKQPSGNDGAAARNRGGGYVPSGGHESSPDRIREAMGLKM